MLTIQPFNVEDITKLIPREPDNIYAQMYDLTERSREYKQRGPCYTGFWNGEPMVCAGVIVLWDGLGEGWAYTSDLVRQHPFVFYKWFKQMMEETAKQSKLRRLQVSLPKSYKTSRAWLASMGFKKEGLMPKFGPEGATYVRMARLF